MLFNIIFSLRLFNFIDYLTNEKEAATEAENDDVESERKDFMSFTEENYNQSHVIQTLKVLVYQSSRKILKLMIKRLTSLFKERHFNTKAGDILSSFCGYLVKSGYGREAFEIFFNHVYDNLTKYKDTKECKHLTLI